jgi:iron-sulfur cluster insertion protein
MLILEPGAVERIQEILTEENNPSAKLRVFVQGGGCSGMQYGFTLDEQQNEDDFVHEFGNISVLVDSISAQYLENARIDYRDDLSGSSFVIDNPQAETTCGCGSSFSPY